MIHLLPYVLNLNLMRVNVAFQAFKQFIFHFRNELFLFTDFLGHLFEFNSFFQYILHVFLIKIHVWVSDFIMHFKEMQVSEGFATVGAIIGSGMTND